jgi:hypothetical protein
VQLHLKRMYLRWCCISAKDDGGGVSRKDVRREENQDGHGHKGKQTSHGPAREILQERMPRCPRRRRDIEARYAG